MVDTTEDGGDTTVACEGEHHARVAGEGEEASMVDAWMGSKKSMG